MVLLLLKKTKSCVLASIFTTDVKKIEVVYLVASLSIFYCYGIDEIELSSQEKVLIHPPYLTSDEHFWWMVHGLLVQQCTYQKLTRLVDSLNK